MIPAALLAVAFAIAAWLYRGRAIRAERDAAEALKAAQDANRALYEYRRRMEIAESTLAAKIAKDAELSNETASFELADGSGFVTIARYDITAVSWIEGKSPFTEVTTGKGSFRIVCPREDFLAWATGKVDRT